MKRNKEGKTVDPVQSRSVVDKPEQYLIQNVLIGTTSKKKKGKEDYRKSPINILQEKVGTNRALYPRPVTKRRLIGAEKVAEILWEASPADEENFPLFRKIGPETAGKRRYAPRPRRRMRSG